MLFGFTTTDVMPDIQADLWLSTGSNHFWYPNQPKPATAWERQIDSLTTELVRTQDTAVRQKLFFQIQEIWNREMPAIPIVSQDVLAGWKTRVGNLRPSILRPHLIWNAEELTVGDR
jgi:peptide/nickel transport system substrate-binding protein